ncbi:uncharacterized protein LOC128238456 isoform X2 [Mya arenaria]|uniref:uncharacterized protein LOC128238456 isoform X2 n=2 Tax=Mya arenaria TaxID=6604 RepID=UPI0022E5BA82|nr:uncharacterized protein LOC128238456 isoform X2 [Mya arenaria]
MRFNKTKAAFYSEYMTIIYAANLPAFQNSEVIAEGSCFMDAALPDHEATTTRNVSRKRPKLSSECKQNLSHKDLSVDAFNASMHASSQSDLSLDQDYGHHSATSSCQAFEGSVRCASVEELAMDQGSLLGMGSQVDQESTDNDSGCLHGENELEDLLYHFRQFFRHQIDQEMSMMHERMYMMLENQQTHVRRIVNTAISGTWNNSPQLPASEPANQNFAEIFQDDDHSTKDETDQQQNCLTVTTRYPQIPVTTASCTNHAQPSQEQDLLGLLSASCSVSSLLAKPQFRS